MQTHWSYRSLHQVIDIMVSYRSYRRNRIIMSTNPPPCVPTWPLVNLSQVTTAGWRWGGKHGCEEAPLWTHLTYICTKVYNNANGIGWDNRYYEKAICLHLPFSCLQRACVCCHRTGLTKLVLPCTAEKSPCASNLWWQGLHSRNKWIVCNRQQVPIIRLLRLMIGKYVGVHWFIS